MDDRYTLIDVPAVDDPPRPVAAPDARRPGGDLRTTLWVVMLVSAVASSALSTTGLWIAAIPFSVAVVACAAALVAQHRRTRA